MKVSVITISYNSALTIEDTIRSVLEQDYEHLEYIIIDGASTDGTLNIIDKYKSQVSRIISEPDKGIYNAMNKGLKLATGDVISILNSDDTFAHPCAVSKMVSKLIETNADTCYGDLVYVQRDNPEKRLRYWRAGEYAPNCFLNGWMPPHPTFFAKAELYKKYGGFNESLKISADYELMLRMLYRNGASTTYLPEVVVKMKAGGMSNSSLRNRIAANREDRLAWKINGLKPNFYTFQLKPLSKLKQFIKR